MKTHVVFVLDRSGSMGGMEKDVIGGYNQFLADQKKLKDEATLTTILFDTDYELLCEAKPIQEVQPITEKEYFVRGCTALLDAMGKAINTVKANAGKKDKVVFLITTDGQENSSHEYNREQIKKLVTELEQKKNWKFVYMGANVDSFTEAGSMGVATAGNYTNSAQGLRSVYDVATTLVTSYRGSSSGQMDTSALTDLK